MPRSLVDLESRSGKTFILIYALIVRACKETSRHCIFRQHFNHVKRSIWLGTFPKVLKTCFPDLKLNLNKTDYIAHFPNGSEIHFAGLDDGDRTEKVLGLEFSTLYFNEASQVDYLSVQMAITRLAEKNGLKKKVYYDFNPPKKSHWSYHLFIKQLEPIDAIPLLNAHEYGSLLMNPHDNLANIDEDYIKLLQSMPEEQRKRFLDGEFGDESEGQVYYAFRRDDHVKETTKYPGTVFSSNDFNVTPMTALIFQYIDNKFHIQDEVYLENSDTYKMAHELKKRGYSGLQVIPDSTGKNRKTSGQSDFQILEQNGFKILPTHNPFVTDRVNNVNRLLSNGRIIIDPKCKKLINDLERVVWKNNELDQSGANKMLTHISDCLGYACWKLDPFTPTLKKVGLQDR
jgi:PBSX family phage terminase large subunit